MNPVLGETPLDLADGRSFILVADHSALVEAAQAYTGSTKLKKLMNDMVPLMGPDGNVLVDEDGDPVKDTIPANVAFLFGLLLTHHPDMTLRMAQNILLSDIDRVAQAMSVAMDRGFPDAKPDSGKVGNGPASPVGKASGRNGAKPVSNRKPSGKPRHARSG